MKYISLLIIVAFALIATVAAGSYSAGAGGGSGSVSIPAPPCPKNYLFSCQPNLVPVPCGGVPRKPCESSAAYTHQIPTYVEAPWNNLYGYQHLY